MPTAINGKYFLTGWRIFLAVMLGFVFPAAAYYVHAEGQQAIVEHQKEAEGTFLLQQQFTDWNRWKYDQDISYLKQQQDETLEAVKEIRKDIKEMNRP